MRDPHIRYPNDPAPLWPGTKDVRMIMAPGDDPDVQRIRREIQNEGKGLFVVYAKDTGLKALIEAYYPEDVRPHYFKDWLDPYRKYEHRLGRLVCINHQVIGWAGELHGLLIEEIQRNNRNARRDLRRSHSKVGHRIALENKLAEEERIAYDRFEQFYTNAVIDTHKFGMAKKHVSQHTPRGSR